MGHGARPTAPALRLRLREWGRDHVTEFTGG